ncbi:helix-loop-helix protein delilah-like [Schistocerca cancellata]|uniref:helix-loop-helix protein delilah-like n=1 Tax=Schistocerca cancellata TaxID=274614 RepID=UPI0021197D84|nr:helix-loop-helix protein delilah-like [Schistocerca cancellata]
MPPCATGSDMDSLIRVETPSSLDSNNNPPENLICPETTCSEGKEQVNGLSGSDSVAEEAAAGEGRKGRYSLRPRSLLRQQITEYVVDECAAAGGGDEREEPPPPCEGGAGSRGGGGGRRARRQAQPLSRYRRRTANARERERMREINAAFEALRRALPPGHPQELQEQAGDKVTKIATLRLAIRYIAELTRALDAVSAAQLPEEPDCGPQRALPPVSSLLTLTAGPLPVLRDDDSPLPLPLPLCLTPPPGLDDLCLEPR